MIAATTVYALEEQGNYRQPDCEAILLTANQDFDRMAPENQSIMRNFVVNFDWQMSTVTRTFSEANKYC